MTTVKESSREVPVLEEVDVLVAGGGVSGCAAAASAARSGAKTLMVERNGFLGGVATASMMANIGNRFLTSYGERAIRGFAGELVDRLVQRGAASPGWENRNVPGCTIDPEKLKVVLIEILRESGVEVLTHAVATNPVIEGQNVKGVFLESKSGREAILAGATVDATGEADLAHRAGAEMTFDGGSASIVFKMANVDIDGFVDFLLQNPEGFPAGMDWVKDLDTFASNWRERGVLFFPHGGGYKWPFFQEAIERAGFQKADGPAHGLDALGMYGFRGDGWVVVNSNFYTIKDLDVRSLSAFELHAQKMCYKVGEFLIGNVPGFSSSHVAQVGVDLGIRGSRSIVGRTTLQKESLVDPPGPFHADDVIGVTVAIDTDRTQGEFFHAFTCDVPFGIMVPRGVKGLLVGSAKSVDTQYRGLIRGMTGCMICGQAAGVACALGARDGIDPGEVPIRSVQRELLRQGANLGTEERIRELGLA